MILNYFCGRENGTLEPVSWTRAEVTRRNLSVDVSKHKDFQKIHATAINTIDVDPEEGRYLLSGGSDGVMVIYDLHATTGCPTATYTMLCTVGRSNRYNHKHSVETVQWYPQDSGMFISSGTDKFLKVWDANTLVAVEDFTFRHRVYSHDMSAVARQHSLIAVGTESSQVVLVDLQSGSASHRLQGHNASVTSVRWSKRQEYILASGSNDSKVILWDIRSAKSCLMVLDQHNGESKASTKSVNTAHNGKVNGIEFTPDGLQLMTYGTDCRLRLWDAISGKNTMVNYGKIDNDFKTCVKFAIACDSHPGFVYVPTDNEIYMFDLWSGRRVKVLQGHYSRVNAVVYQRDTHELYSGASDRSILAWTPQTGADQAYDEHLQDSSRNTTRLFQTRTDAASSRAATQDAWSSDED